MTFTKKSNVLIILGIVIPSVIGFAAVGLSYASSSGYKTSSVSAADDSYLEPCSSCNPTDEDYENLTTFELLTIYPELSDDPLDNMTSMSTNSTSTSSLGNSTDATSTMENTTSSNQTSTSNSTGINSTSVY